MATVLDLYVDQGSQYFKEIRVLNQDGSLYDLSGVTARMQLREHLDSELATLELSTTSGGLVVNLTNNTVEITINHDTQFTYKQYVYDLEIVSSTSIPKRILQGTVFVSREVTR